MRRSRKAVSKEITQWLKTHGRTPATGSQAATLIANLRSELDAALAENERLKEMNSLQEQELDSYRAHDADMELSDPSQDDPGTPGSEWAGFDDDMAALPLR